MNVTNLTADDLRVQPNAESSLTDWLNYMQNIHVSAIDMGLERVLPVFVALGLDRINRFDQAPKPFIFTVAGTNGKGSTTAMIAEICQSAGYKTALYQSPHVLDFNERVRIDGRNVSDALLVEAFVAVETARVACGLTLSFFEMTTLAAFWIFAQAECAVWVLEVGLGGRLDVVNVLDPSLVVITNVGIDHVDWLGETREQIGFEKAGILRPNVPLIYGEADMPQSVADAIDRNEAVCYQLDRDYTFDEAEDGHWLYANPSVTLRLPKPKLALVNAATAISAVLASTQMVNATQSLKIDQRALVLGLERSGMMGRFDRRDLADRSWVFDVAHNLQGIEFLLHNFVPFWRDHQTNHPKARLFLLFSMLADKDVDGVLLALARLPIHGLFLAEIDHPRALPLATLSERVQAHFAPLDHRNLPVQIQTFADFAQATQALIDQSDRSDLLLVCGSFHTIGEVLAQLQN